MNSTTNNEQGGGQVPHVSPIRPNETAAGYESRVANTYANADPALVVRSVQSLPRLESENRALREALETLVAEEWRDDDDPILTHARVKARTALESASTLLTPPQH
jgi:hypothetical protein